MSVVLRGATCEGCNRTFTAQPLPGSDNLLFEEYCPKCSEKNQEFDVWLQKAEQHDPLAKVKQQIQKKEKLKVEQDYKKEALRKLSEMVDMVRMAGKDRIVIPDKEFRRLCSMALVTPELETARQWCHTWFKYKGIIVLSDRTRENLGI